MNVKVLAAAGAAALLALPAYAQTHSATQNAERSPGASTALPPSGMLSFSEIDTNNDGQISRAEWDAAQHRGDAAASGGASRPGTSAGVPTSPRNPSSTNATEKSRSMEGPQGSTK